MLTDTHIDTTINDIQKIFPFVYPGHNGCSEHINYSENTTVLAPHGCGGGGICLTTENGNLKGFGAGGCGTTICAVPKTVYCNDSAIKIYNHSNGNNGCAIVVHLI